MEYSEIEIAELKIRRLKEELIEAHRNLEQLLDNEAEQAEQEDTSTPMYFNHHTRI